MTKQIHYFTRRNYGTDHEYIVDKGILAAVGSLLGGRATVSPNIRIQLANLMTHLGITLEWVEVPAPK